MIFAFCNKPDMNIKSKNKYVFSACPLSGISRLIRTAHTRTTVIKLYRQVVWLWQHSLEEQYIHSLCWQHFSQDSFCESLLDSECHWFLKAQCLAFGLHCQFPTCCTGFPLSAHPAQPSEAAAPADGCSRSPPRVADTQAPDQDTAAITTAHTARGDPSHGTKQGGAAAGCCGWPELKSPALRGCSSQRDLSAHLDFTAALIIKHIPNLILREIWLESMSSVKRLTAVIPRWYYFPWVSTEEEELLGLGSSLLPLRLCSLKWPQTVMWDTDVC